MRPDDLDTPPPTFECDGCTEKKDLAQRIKLTMTDNQGTILDSAQYCRTCGTATAKDLGLSVGNWLR